eukprot:5949220-Alexandrium_andersonii.AAC.1
MYSASAWSARTARRLTSASSGNRATKKGSMLPKGSGDACRASRATMCSWSRAGAPVSGSAAGGGRRST